MSFVAREKLTGDRVSMTMRVINPFGTEHEQFTTNDPRFTQITQRMRHVRGVLLNVRWNFGRPLKERRLDEGEPSVGSASR